MPALSRARILCKKSLIGDNGLPFVPTSDVSAVGNVDTCVWFRCASGNAAVSAGGGCCCLAPMPLQGLQRVGAVQQQARADAMFT